MTTIVTNTTITAAEQRAAFNNCTIAYIYRDTCQRGLPLWQVLTSHGERTGGWVQGEHRTRKAAREQLARDYPNIGQA